MPKLVFRILVYLVVWGTIQGITAWYIGRWPNMLESIMLVGVYALASAGDIVAATYDSWFEYR